MKNRFFAVVSVPVLAMSLAACSDGKPSKDAYIEALQTRSKSELAEDSPELWVEYMDDYMRCVGEVSHETVSAEYIEAMIDSDATYQHSDEDAKAVEVASQECTDKVPMPDIKDDENPDVVDDAQWDDGNEEFEEDFEDGVGDVDDDGEPVGDSGADTGGEQSDENAVSDAGDETAE